MTYLARLRRQLLFAGTLLVLLYLCLLIGIASPRDGSQAVILPNWSGHAADVGVILLVASQLVAVAIRRGWRRVVPLFVLVPLVLFVALAANLVSKMTQRVEVDRITLPDGRVVMMTHEPVPTDTVFAVWEQADSLRWRPLYVMPDQITYSEDGSFTTDPRLVVSDNGAYLLLRRGGIWTDCWAIGRSPSLCLAGEVPSTRDEWLERSRRIAAVVGADPA